MRLRAWSAFASNNSGSYTIVGRFPDEGTASAVAEELAALVAEHSKWFEGQGYERGEAEERSPLERFADAQGIAVRHGAGRDDDWPSYGSPPEVLADGTQVVLHVDYTVTMPALFGELMYRRGGRVDIELDHTHDPLVWVHEIWWPWQGRDEAAVAAGRVRLLDVLFAEAGVMRTQVAMSQPPSWIDAGGRFGHADLSLAAVWRAPMAAIPQVRAAVQSAGAHTRLRVMEAVHPRDPAGLFRPCRPRPSESLVDVVIEALGPEPQAVLEAIAAVVLSLHGGHPGSTQAAASLVAERPATVAWAQPRDVAEACARRLEATGATVRVTDHAYPERLIASPDD